MGNQWATMDTVLPEKMIRHNGTIPGQGGKITFWMFNPPYYEEKPVIRCGICKEIMPYEAKHCPNCYPKGDN